MEKPIAKELLGEFFEGLRELFRKELSEEIRNDMREEMRTEVREELRDEMRQELSKASGGANGGVDGSKQYAYSKQGAKYTVRFLKKLLEARQTYSTDKNGKKGRPLISPQEFEIGVYLVSRRLRNSEKFGKRIFSNKLDALSQDFAKYCNYRGLAEGSTRGADDCPDKSVMQKALKKLDKLGLINYRLDTKRVKGRKTEQTGIVISLLPIKKAALTLTKSD